MKPLLKSYSKAIIRHFVNLNVKVKSNDLVYTMAERRSHPFHRAYVIAIRTEFEDDSFKFGKIRRVPPKIGFIFTGHGGSVVSNGTKLGRNISQS